MSVFVGLLFVAVSIPLILRRVRPNPWYGFRTPKTLSSEHIWYEANAYSGALLLVAGLVTAAAGIVLALLPLNWVARELAGLAVMLFSLIWVVVRSFRYLQTL
ncbi:MAG: SdpI family protein [Armatimonadetes bacterium]|nr:SdpI family protein [Armatimonadota bacterium]